MRESLNACRFLALESTWNDVFMKAGPSNLTFLATQCQCPLRCGALCCQQKAIMQHWRFACWQISFHALPLVPLLKSKGRQIESFRQC